MYTFIDSINDLAYLDKELSQKPYLGVDTEFRRTRKDNMKLALLQVNDNEEIYLIDTIQIDNPGSSASFLFTPSVTKIFHSCKEDLEAVYSWTDQAMKGIFDTQIGNSLLGGDFSIGYQGLVEKEMDIVLNKSETRSNWTRRPLSDSQLKYATLDVEYLIYLYQIQIQELTRTSKLDWHNQEINKLLEITFSPSSSYSKLERMISKEEEADLLLRFNNAVEKVSKRESINPTLFFSKKSQREFLRLVFSVGLDLACNHVTPWRGQLIKEELLNLLK